MVESLSLQEENITKDIRNTFRQKKKKKKDRTVRDISNLFEHEEDYYKPVIVNNFWTNKYSEYKTKGVKKTLSVEEYVNKIKPYLRDIINDLKKSDTWKIQWPITISFISSKDDQNEKHEMHSKLTTQKS